MIEFLAFQLYGPLAAWGDIAVGEHRPTFAHPTKSAVLGLVAAALGIRRDDEAAHGRLHDGFGFAVRVDAPGVLLRDYHTAQVPPQRRGARYWTRRDELEGAVGTILSTRDYYCDARYTTTLWSRDVHTAHSLQDIQRALEQPAFVLYLGRKSCPPALPLAPRILRATTLREALDQVSIQQLGAIRLPESVDVYWEDPCVSGIDAVHTVSRRDRVDSRRRWQFTDRVERYATISAPRVGEE